MVDTVGDKIRVEPVPLVVPPQEPEYHFQIAPTPKLPPVKLRVVGEPLQRYTGEAVAEIAGEDVVHTVTVALTHVEVLHVP